MLEDVGVFIGHCVLKKIKVLSWLEFSCIPQAKSGELRSCPVLTSLHDNTIPLSKTEPRARN